MRCSFNPCHGLVQGFLKEDTFRSTSSMLSFHRSEDLGRYRDASSYGFPKQRQKQPPDSPLLSKGLLLSWSQHFPIFSFTSARVFLPKLMEKGPRAGPCQQTAPESSPGTAPGVHHSALLLQPWNLAWGLQHTLATKHVEQDKPKHVTACGIAQAPVKRAVLSLNPCWFNQFSPAPVARGRGGMRPRPWVWSGAMKWS